MLFPVTARGLMSIYQSYHKSLCLKVTYTRRYKISGAKCEAFIVICKSEEVVKKKKNSTGTQWVTPCTRVSRFFPMWKCEQLVPLTVTHKREPAFFFPPPNVQSQSLHNHDSHGLPLIWIHSPHSHFLHSSSKGPHQGHCGFNGGGVFSQTLAHSKPNFLFYW